MTRSPNDADAPDMDHEELAHLYVPTVADSPYVTAENTVAWLNSVWYLCARVKPPLDVNNPEYSVTVLVFVRMKNGDYSYAYARYSLAHRLWQVYTLTGVPYYLDSLHAVCWCTLPPIVSFEVQHDTAE